MCKKSNWHVKTGDKTTVVAKFKLLYTINLSLCCCPSNYGSFFRDRVVALQPSRVVLVVSPVGSPLKAAIANLVVMVAFSSMDNDTYCIVTPCECRMAIVILAMCIPLLTAAVANPLRRLCKVAFCQPNFGA